DVVVIPVSDGGVHKTSQFRRGVIDLPGGAVNPFCSSSISAVILVQDLSDMLFARVPDCSSTTLEEQHLCSGLDLPDPTRVLSDFPLCVIRIAGASVMQGVISKIVTCFNCCGPVGLIVNEVKAEFFVSATCIDPPCAEYSSLSHQWDGKSSLTPERVVTAHGKRSSLAFLPFTNVRV